MAQSERDTRSVFDARFPWVTVHDRPERSADTAVLNRFRALDDLSSTVSDVLDELGVHGAVPASVLAPSISDAKIVGIATTVRNVEQQRSAFASVSDREWRMAEILALKTAGEDDVLVIEGLHEVSNMGGLMASIAQRQGFVGAVVDGGVRDVGRSRALGFPVWSRDRTPITGKWRSVTVEVNGIVRMGGLQVSAGDLVIADETGVCCVPADLIDTVLVRAEQIADFEAQFEDTVQKQDPVEALIERLYGTH